VPDADLRTIPGLQENHRRALAAKLGITSLRALADGDQRALYTALGSIRPRPSLARIATWQEDARSRLADAAAEEPDWDTVASFAVIFAQRLVNGVWERQLHAEQTEVEPPSHPRQWPTWECGPLCDWMLSQLDLPSQEAASEAAADETRAAGGGRAELRIDSARITDNRRALDLISGGDVIAEPPDELVPPVRLTLTVGGGRSGQELQAAVWFRRRAEPGWCPDAPVTLPGPGQAEFDLSSVPPGRHDIRLLAWATHPGATLAAITLPTLTFAVRPV
jgi:hypothetical protein